MTRDARENCRADKGTAAEWDSFQEIAPGTRVGRLPECWIEDVVNITHAKMSKDTASTETMRRVRRTNDSAFWGLFARIHGEAHQLVGYFAQLLLNDDGYRALLARTLDLKEPPGQFLASTGERPAAVYLWGVVAEKKTAIFQPFLTQQLSELGGLPHFARLATEGGLKTGRRYGLRPVTPDDDCVGGLFVLPRKKKRDDGNFTLGREPLVRVKTVSTAEELEQARAIRAAVFMSEQKCPYEEEFDGNDYSASHIIAFTDGAPAATMRIRFFSDWVKLERMAVLLQYRPGPVKKAIIEYAFELVRRKGYRRCYGQAQRRLLNFWIGYGFQVFPRNTEIRFSDHDYVEIWRDLDPHPEALTMTSNPMVINRPEGQWDVAGILEKSSVRPATRPC